MKFREAFIFLIGGSDPSERGAREGRLARTEFVPVPTVETASEVAAELVDHDLIELYNGLGPRAGAAVIRAVQESVPVGMVGTEYTDPVQHSAIVFAAPDADPETERYVHNGEHGRMTILTVPDPLAVPSAAVWLADEGCERIEICGGLGPVPAAAAMDAVAGRQVGSVMFGFESLPGVTAYRNRYGHALTS